MAKKNKIDIKKDVFDARKALGMVAVSPRDKVAMKTFYKFYNKKHNLKLWLVKFEKDGFNIKNSNELKDLIK